MAKRFRWTRKTYLHAHHLARVMDIYRDGPEILRRYRELWAGRDDWRQDPLTVPLRTRLQARKDFDDEIPF